MTRFIRISLLAGAVSCVPVTDVGADTVGEASPPDPAMAWQRRDFSLVQAWLASASQGAADRAAVLRAQAWLARREGEGDAALTLIDHAIELAPDRPDLRVDRAAFLSDQIDDAGPFKSLRIARDVRSDLEHAVAVAPDDVDAVAALAAFHQRAPGIAGGDKEQAAALMARLGELSPARLHFREALQWADGERFEEALAEITLAIAQTDWPRPLWLVQMGDWLQRLGFDERALAAYRQALSEAPRYTPALYALGRLSSISGLETDAGVNALRRFLELPRWPNDPEARLAWRNLGQIYARSGCTSQAASAYRRALELESSWREPRQLLEQLPRAGASNAPCEYGRAGLRGQAE